MEITILAGFPTILNHFLSQVCDFAIAVDFAIKQFEFQTS